MRIKEARKSRKMSQQDLADAMGLKRSTVSMWEIGASTPSGTQLADLCKILDVSSDYILELSPQKEKAPPKETLIGEIPPETYERLAEDERKLKLAEWISAQDDETLSRLERILAALDM